MVHHRWYARGGIGRAIFEPTPGSLSRSGRVTRVSPEDVGAEHGAMPPSE